MRIGQALAMTPEYRPNLQMYGLDLVRLSVVFLRNSAVGCSELTASLVRRGSSQSSTSRLPMLRESSTEKPSER